MTVIDSGACRTSSGAGQTAATQASSDGLRGSFQDRADALVRATVLSDLGQDAGSPGHGRHSHGIQAVAAAVRKVLSAQDVTGTDASDDVLKKIETSLHKAAQALADRGVDGKTIDATIDRFRAQLANALDAGTGGTPAPAPTPTRTSGVTSASNFVSREVRKERGAIDLVTAEGDRVSIRFRSRDVVTGSAVQASSSDGTSVSATSSSLFSRGGVQIEVDGNLNADELKAINDLLGKVDDIATKFFSGDVQDAFSAAGSLGVDSDQIAAYRLDVTYSRKVAAVYSAVSAASLPVSTQSSPGSSSSASPASTPDSSGTPVTSAAATDNASSASAPEAGTAPANSTDATAAATSNAPPASPASAQKTIIDFINDTLSKLGSASGAGRVSFSMHWKINALVTALDSVQPAQATTPADQAAATNTQLLGDLLQKIAAA